MRKTKSSLKAFILPACVIELLHKTLYSCLLTQDDRVVLNYFHWQESVMEQVGKAHLRSTQRRTEFLPGAFADCRCLPLLTLSGMHGVKLGSWYGPPGGEIHLKFGLWGTIKTPNSLPKFKLAWNLPLCSWVAWIASSLLFSVMWHSVSDVATQFVFAC